MSQVFHGVVLRTSGAQAKVLFGSIDSVITLRLVQLDKDVFGIYARRHTDYPGDLSQVSRQLAKIPNELGRIAAELSRSTGEALLYWYDSRVGALYQLFENGEMTRESNPENYRKVWGSADALESIGARSDLHAVIENCFLYDSLEPLEVRAPKPRHWETRK
jgi:hypothetical protein